MYKIVLSDAEIATLAWCADRGYFPLATYDGLTLADDESEDVDNHTPRVWTLAESDAWPILEHREEDSHSLFACIGGELFDKLLELEGSIV